MAGTTIAGNLTYASVNVQFSLNFYVHVFTAVTSPYKDT